MNKKRLIITASLVLTVALVASGISLAYLTSSKTAVNRVGIASMVPNIHENSSTTPNSVNSVPGTNTGVFPKEIRVQNTDITNAVDAYVRVQLVPTLRDASSNLGGNFKMTDPASNQIVFSPFTDKDLTITLVFASGWNSKWKYRASDNCFYYTDIVKPGHYTEQPLLSEVIFSGDDAGEYQTKFNLDVLTDSIQADGKIGTKYAAEEAWPVSVNNRILTPIS